MSIQTVLILTVLAVLPFLDAGESDAADLLLAFALFTLLVLGCLGQKNRVRFPRLPLSLFLSFIIFSLVSGLISTYYSVSFIESAFELLPQVSLLLFVLVGLPFLTRPKFLEWLANLLTLVAFLLSLISFYFLLPGVKPWPADISFFYATYGHNRLAEYLVLTLPLIAAKLVFHKPRRKIHSLIFTVIFTAFLLTFSRLSWFILALSPIVFFLVRPHLFRRYFSVKLPVFSLGLIGLVVFSLWPVNLLDKPLNLTPRLEYFQKTWESVRYSIWLGYGPGTFQFSNTNRLAEPRITAYAHNLFLQDLYETGLLGFSVKVIFLITFTALALKSARSTSRPLEAAAVTGVILSLLHAQFDFGWQITAVQLTAWLLLLAVVSRYSSSPLSPRLKLVLWSLALLPIAFILFTLVNPLLNRQVYKQKIEIADASQNSSASTNLLRRWRLLDWGNGQMYLWRAHRFLRLGDFAAAALEFRRAYFAPLRNGFIDTNLTNAFIDNYLSDSSQISAEEMAAILEVLYRAFSPYDFLSYNPPSYHPKIKNVIDKIIQSSDFSNFDDRLKAMIYYWRYFFEPAFDNRTFSSYQKFIDQAKDLDPDNQEYQRLAEINRVLANSNQDIIRQKITEVESLVSSKNKKPDIYRFLLAHLYTSLADFYQSRLQLEPELQARQEAIRSQPYLGSPYLHLAKRLQELGQPEQSKHILIECESKLGPDCRLWYAEFIGQSP